MKSLIKFIIDFCLVIISFNIVRAIFGDISTWALAIVFIVGCLATNISHVIDQVWKDEK